MSVVLMSPQAGDKYLIDANPDARGGFGQAFWTTDARHAKRFPSFDAALRFWQQQSVVRPYRTDGGVNRPLTAYHMLLTIVDDDDSTGR